MSSSRSRYSQAARPPDTGPHQSTAPLEVRWIPIFWPLRHACARNPCHRTHTHNRRVSHTGKSLCCLPGAHPTKPNTRLLSPCETLAASAGRVEPALRHRRLCNVAFLLDGTRFSPTRHACSPAVHHNIGKTPYGVRSHSTSINSLPTREASTPHDAIPRIGHGPSIVPVSPTLRFARHTRRSSWSPKQRTTSASPRKPPCWLLPFRQKHSFN